MKKLLFFFLLLLTAIHLKAQLNEKPSSGFGAGGGVKMYNGVIGLIYNYSPTIYSKSLEFNFGAGYRQGLVLNLGSKFRIYNNSKKVEMFLAFNYSYQFSGELRFGSDTKTGDYYSIENTQYLHYFLSGRYWIDTGAAIQLNCGYSHNIGGINITHKTGPDEHYNSAKNIISSGLLLGLDLIIFPRVRKNEK